MRFDILNSLDSFVVQDEKQNRIIASYKNAIIFAIILGEIHVNFTTLYETHHPSVISILISLNVAMTAR